MIRVRTLGQCSIQLDTCQVAPDAEMVFASLLLLAVEPGRRVERSELLGMLWPDTAPARASHCLRQTLYRLRTLGAPLEGDRTHVVLSPNVVDSDVQMLLTAHRPDSVERLADSICGPFLPGYAPVFSEPFRDWVERQRDVISAAARRVLVSAIAARKARGEWADVERLSHRCLAIDPLNEEATLALAEAAAMHGGKAEALAILDRYLREMGPTARELRVPAVALRRRIAEPELEFPLAPPVDVPFVGRSAEMATLTAALRSARAGAGSVYFIHGEPGIGKTRLLTEFSRACALQGVRVAAARCQSSDIRRPLSAFVDLVAKLLAMPGGLGCSPESHRYLRRLIEHQSNDVPPAPDTSEAVLLYANVRRSLFDLFDAIASEAELLVTIEDAHWLDGASWEIVAELGPWVGTRRLMLVLTSREREPRYPIPQPPSRELVSLCLLPIDREARGVLFDAVARDRRSVPDFKEWCVTMSGGNPYYLHELALRGSGIQGEFEVPPSLAALVARRVARLRPISCRILQACAVLGKNATLRRIQRMLERSCAELLDGFDELDRAGLLETRGESVIARHDLLAEAATSQVSTLSQQLLHRQAAELLEDEVLKSRVPSLAWDSAEHWRLSGEAARGIQLALSCARWSLHCGRPVEGVDVLQRVLPWCFDAETRLQLLIEYAHALRAAERWTDLADVLERILHTDQGLSPEVRSSYRLELQEARFNAGHHSPRILDELVAECAIGIASATARIRAATVAVMVSDNLCCADIVSRVELLVRPLVEVHADELVSRDYELVYQCGYGDLERAVTVALCLVESVRGSKNEPLLCKYLLRAGHALEIGDRLEESVLFAREAFVLAEKFGLAGSACLAARRLAWAYLDRVDTIQMTEWAKVGAEWAKRTQHPASVADIAMLRAEVALASGAILDARALFDESLSLWGPLRHPRAEAHALALKLALAVETGHGPNSHDLSDTWRLFKLLGNRSMLDLVIGRFALALAAGGRLEDSARMVSEYFVHQRRERGPARPVFRRLFARAVEEFGVDWVPGIGRYVA